jgi:hypothetical protein
MYQTLLQAKLHPVVRLRCQISTKPIYSDLQRRVIAKSSRVSTLTLASTHLPQLLVIDCAKDAPCRTSRDAFMLSQASSTARCHRVGSSSPTSTGTPPPRVCASSSTQGHAHIARGHHRRQPSTSTNFTTSSSPLNLVVNVNANKIFFFSY